MDPGLDAARRPQCRLAQSVAGSARFRRRRFDQRLFVCRTDRPRRSAFGHGAVSVHPSCFPRHGRDARRGRSHGRRQRMAHAVADQFAAADARPARFGHPVVRRGDGVVRDPATARHSGQHRRVHHPDLRSGLWWACCQLRCRDGAGADPAGADRQSDRRAVAASAWPLLHDSVGPRLQRAAHRPRLWTMDRLRRHASCSSSFSAHCLLSSCC